MADTVQPVSEQELQQRIQAQRARQQARATPSAEPGSPAPDVSVSRRRKGRANRGQQWMRWLHVYTSMIAFAVILFFGVTGLLLNHPSWLFGDELVTTLVTGSLPEEVLVESGQIEFLAVSEYFRNEQGIVGEVNNFAQVGTEGSINYVAPGYSASAKFDVTTLAFDITVREDGFVNAMRDLHTGSDSGSTWSLIIDGSAIFLVVVSVSGLGIQLLMHKRRRKALAWLAVGTLATIGLIMVAMA